jgi:hypothetical protein
MTYESYSISSDEGGPFEESFKEYAMQSPKAAARLATSLQKFASNRAENGEFLRGNGPMSVYVVPFRDQLDGEKAAGALAIVDDSKQSIDVSRFLPPSKKHRWSDHIKWAEKLLRI